MDAHRQPDRRPPSGDFLDRLEVHLVGLPATLVIGQAEQTGATEYPHGVSWVLPRRFRSVDAWGELLVGDVADEGDELAGLGVGNSRSTGTTSYLLGLRSARVAAYERRARAIS